MALRAVKDKLKPHYFELQMSPCGGAVSEKPRKPGKNKTKKLKCYRLQILHKTKIHFFKKG